MLCGVFGFRRRTKSYLPVTGAMMSISLLRLSSSTTFVAPPELTVANTYVRKFILVCIVVFFYCILLQYSNTCYLHIRLLFQNDDPLHRDTGEGEASDNSPKQRQRPRSRTGDSDQKLPHLPMLEDETHELPLPRRIHPAPNPTTERKRSQHQHPGSSHQEILRHTIQQQKPGRVKSPQRREDLLIKRHSRRDDKSPKKPVLSHSQRIVRHCSSALRVPPHLPPLKLDQTDSTRRGLHPRPGKNGATERSGDTGERVQADSQPIASRRDDTRNSILHH